MNTWSINTANKMYNGYWSKSTLVYMYCLCSAKEGTKSYSILYPAVIAVSLTHYLNMHSISKLVCLCLVK